MLYWRTQKKRGMPALSVGSRMEDLFGYTMKKALRRRDRASFIGTSYPDQGLGDH